MRGLLVGRFQPFHRGHLELVRRLVGAQAPDPLIVAIGSAEQSFTWENPFTAGERFEMIDRALAEARIDRVAIVPVPDIQRHGLWVRYLEGLLPRFDRVYSHNPLTVMLFDRAGYRTVRPPFVERRRFEGARVRRMLARGAQVRALVPPAVDRFLGEIGAAGRLAGLRPSPAPGRRPARR